MTNLNIFKIEYHWHEGEYEEALLGKEAQREEFEKDLLKAKAFAESLIGKEVEEGEYLGKGYRIDCLPEYYEQIIWFLTEKLGYFVCSFDETIDYSVDDFQSKNIGITKSEKKLERRELKC